MCARGRARSQKARGPKGRAHKQKSPGVIPGFFLKSERNAHEQPVVEPQVSHFRQVPLRTSVKFWHSGQDSPT